MKAEQSAVLQAKLQKPGAGLPFFQGLIARYFVVPLKSRQMSWDEANRFFLRESEKIVTLAAQLDAKTMETQVLVPKMVGIEDSSRFWSPAMTLEHLIIVAPAMAELIFELSHGRRPVVVVDTAKVKPQKKFGAGEVLGAFSQMTEFVSNRVMSDVKDRKSKVTHAHPWFGQLTAHQWNWLLGSHQWLHRKQLQAILECRTLS